MAGIQPSNGVAPANTQGGITNPNLADGCDNLWYAPRCNPRLDPFAMNNLISEIINAVNGSCGCADDGTFTGLAYDCTRNDNLCEAIRNHITQYFFDCCLPENFPLLNGACSIEQLVVQTDAAGCRRIARYTDALAQIAASDASSSYPPNGPVRVPETPNDQDSYYFSRDLLADQQANIVDEAKLANTILTTVTFDLACASRVEICFSGTANFSPGADGGDGRRTMIAPRIDGVFTNNGDNITGPVIVTNFEQSAVGCAQVDLAAGNHTVTLYALGFGNQGDLNAVGIGVGYTALNAVPADMTITLVGG